MIWAGHVARVGDRRVLYRVLGSKHECKRPLGTPRSRWDNNINMHLQVTECSVDCSNLAQLPDLGKVDGRIKIICISK
jgi:hypothetical protein